MLIFWLNVILAVIVVLILVLAGLYLYFVVKAKKEKEEAQLAPATTKQSTATFNGLGKEDIRRFMEFDEIKDDMIIRKNNEQFVMVIQCKGINYDLMSEEEKLSIESGFVQFLNTIRFPIQLYVQTRSLNLKNTVDSYKGKVEEIANSIKELELRKADAINNGNKKLEERMDFEIRRKQNVLEYGADVTEYIGKMSLNKNVLQQKTYVIISFYASDLGSISNYSKEEIRNLCFSELYTRCQSVIQSLFSCQVMGRVLNSEELAELLYVAYNRDDSELLQLSRALDAEYDALYSTAKDVLKKKQEKIEEEVELKAIDLASDAIIEADNRRKEKQKQNEEVRKKALEVVDEYQDNMEEELYEETKKVITNLDMDLYNGEEPEEEEKPKRKTTRRKKA